MLEYLCIGAFVLFVLVVVLVFVGTIFTSTAITFKAFFGVVGSPANIAKWFRVKAAEWKYGKLSLSQLEEKQRELFVDFDNRNRQPVLDVVTRLIKKKRLARLGK